MTHVLVPAYLCRYLNNNYSDLHDIDHTFKKGHHIIIKVQSTWFPLIDRNPQKFVPNIYDANESDYIKATQRIYFSADYPTYIELPVMKN